MTVDSRTITKRYLARQAVFALADIIEWPKLFTEVELDQLTNVIVMLSDIATGERS